jgi:DNA-binding transcriptional regulator GbsR (MarR family)
MDYNLIIMDCIKKKFLSVKEISEITGINKSRVSIRLNNLLKYNMVMSIQGQSTKLGPKPLLYKKI